MIEKINKWLPAINTVAIIVLILVGGNNQYGGTTNYDDIDVSDGYAVDGTTVIDGSGNVDAAITSSTGTFSSTLTTNGGSIYSYTLSTSSAKTTYTMIQADLLHYNTILATLSGGGTTWTLPASSTITSLVPAAGDRQTQCYLPLTNNLTFVAGTGIDLKGATSTGVGGPFDRTIKAGGMGCFEFVRQADTDISAGLLEYEDID